MLSREDKGGKLQVARIFAYEKSHLSQTWVQGFVKVPEEPGTRVVHSRPVFAILLVHRGWAEHTVSRETELTQHSR